MTYTIVVRKDHDGNFCVSVPAIQGCFTCGLSWEEALRNAEEAILCSLEEMAANGEPAPPDPSPICIDMEECEQVVLQRLAVAEAVTGA